MTILFRGEGLLMLLELTSNAAGWLHWKALENWEKLSVFSVRLLSYSRQTFKFWKNSIESFPLLLRHPWKLFTHFPFQVTIKFYVCNVASVFSGIRATPCSQTLWNCLWNAVVCAPSMFPLMNIAYSHSASAQFSWSCCSFYSLCNRNVSVLH